MSERVHRSMMNIKVGMLFYILSLFLAFFSRKIFLDCLGAEFIGLTGMLMNIMSFLSVAELGIGTSIVYFLYKPLQEDNHNKINEVMSMLGFLYRCIGAIIGIMGKAHLYPVLDVCVYKAALSIVKKLAVLSVI